MLYLFDIDGTLVDTGGAGMTALREATAMVFGDQGPELDLAGSTDLGLIANIHAHFGIEPTSENIDAYFGIYHKRPEWNLTHGGFPGRVIEGAPALLDHLHKRGWTTIGLLTGNTMQGAATKVRHFGLADYFPFGAYGCDHADRNRLGPVALERAMTHSGRSFEPQEIWIIGDTPKDIACAHAFGARCLAVATGAFSRDALQAHGADLVVNSLDEALDLI